MALLYSVKFMMLWDQSIPDGFAVVLNSWCMKACFSVYTSHQAPSSPECLSIICNKANIFFTALGLLTWPPVTARVNSVIQQDIQAPSPSGNDKLVTYTVYWPITIIKRILVDHHYLGHKH